MTYIYLIPLFVMSDLIDTISCDGTLEKVRMLRGFEDSIVIEEVVTFDRMQIGDFSLKKRAQFITEKLGNPECVIQDTINSEMPNRTFYHYIYNGFYLYFMEDSPLIIETFQADYKTPDGIYVGMSINSALQKLGVEKAMHVRNGCILLRTANWAATMRIVFINSTIVTLVIKSTAG